MRRCERHGDAVPLQDILSNLSRDSVATEVVVDESDELSTTQSWRDFDAAHLCVGRGVWTVEQRLGQGGDDLVNLVDISVKEELAASQAGFVGPLDQQLHEVFD